MEQIQKIEVIEDPKTYLIGITVSNAYEKNYKGRNLPELQKEINSQAVN
jgi:hypothetical protein